MIRIEDMAPAEMHQLLERASFGHLGCARAGRPYVVPMHYAFADGRLYFFTTKGMKASFISENPEVCLQVEEVTDPSHWRSVMVNGKAERLTDRDEVEHAMQLILNNNPSLTPAISDTQIDAWGREVEVVLYRVAPEIIDGRKTI